MFRAPRFINLGAESSVLIAVADVFTHCEWINLLQFLEMQWLQTWPVPRRVWALLLSCDSVTDILSLYSPFDNSRWSVRSIIFYASFGLLNGCLEPLQMRVAYTCRREPPRPEFENSWSTEGSSLSPDYIGAIFKGFCQHEQLPVGRERQPQCNATLSAWLEMSMEDIICKD